MNLEWKLVIYIKQRMTYKSKLIRGMHRWTKICKKKITFNEKLHKLLEETKKVKPFNFDSVFIENNEFKKKNILLQIKLKALLMEEKDVDLWWDVI